MPRLRPDGTHYPSMAPHACAVCGAMGTLESRVTALAGVYAHKACRANVPACRQANCTNDATTKGLCKSHYNKAYYRADVNGQRERARRWGAANPERVAAKNAARDKSQMAAQARAWYHGNRMRALANAHNARAQRLGASGTVTAEQLLGRLLVFGGRCYLCHGEPSGFDHVKPLTRGGLNIASNMRPACASCNSAKGKTWKETA